MNEIHYTSTYGTVYELTENDEGYDWKHDKVFPRDLKERPKQFYIESQVL